MKTLYVDMDSVMVDFASGIDRIDAQTQKKFQGNLDNVPGIFARMDPMPHALECYADLTHHFDTYILSTAPWENPTAWHDKLVWVKQHLGPYAHKRLILSHNKHLNIGHSLVDDRPNNGAERFGGGWIRFGSLAFPNWPSVQAYLMERKRTMTK